MPTNNKRTAQRVGGLQKVVDQWLKLKAKADEIAEKLDPLAQKLKEAARELLDKAEADGVDARTMTLQGAREGAAAQIVFVSRSKEIPAARASHARSVLGELGPQFLQDKLEVKLDSELARWFIDTVVPHHNVDPTDPRMSIKQTTAVTPEFLERKLALRPQLDAAQLQALRDLQDQFLHQPRLEPKVSERVDAGREGALPAPPPPPAPPAR